VTLILSISTTILQFVASRCSVQVPPNKQLYVFEVDGSIRVAEDEVFAPTVCGSQTAAQVLCAVSNPARACRTHSLVHNDLSNYCRQLLFAHGQQMQKLGMGFDFSLLRSHSISLTGTPGVPK
jgi:hypothetical protein